MDSIKKKIRIKKSVQAPVKKGEKAGSADYYLGKEKIGSVDLVFDRDIKKQKYRDYLKKSLGNFYGKGPQKYFLRRNKKTC